MQQTNPNVGFYAQDEWKAGRASHAEPRAALRPAVARDDRHRHQQRLAARRLCLVPFDSRSTVVRGSAGLFFDRVPLRALANALLSAGNTTDLDATPADQHQPVADPGGRAGVSRLSSAPRCPSVTLVNLTTMDRESAERLFAPGAASRWSSSSATAAPSASAINTCAGVSLLMSINQNVPSCVASGTNNGCRPNPGYANNSQYSSAGDSNYHGLHLSFMQRPARVGLLPRQLHVVEVDEQRRRVLLQLADRSVRSCRRTGAGPTTISAIVW